MWPPYPVEVPTTLTVDCVLKPYLLFFQLFHVLIGLLKGRMVKGNMALPGHTSVESVQKTIRSSIVKMIKKDLFRARYVL